VFLNENVNLYFQYSLSGIYKNAFLNRHCGSTRAANLFSSYIIYRIAFWIAYLAYCNQGKHFKITEHFRQSQRIRKGVNQSVTCHFWTKFHNHKKSPGWGFTKLLKQICKFFVTLGLKTLRLFRLQVLFEADIIKGWC